MACTDCMAHQIGSSEFMDMLSRRSDPSQAFPLAGSIEFTLHCNVRCKHCYIRYPGASKGEMSTEEAKRVLHRLYEKEVLFLLMTGGEIFARPDFPELYVYAKKLGFVITLFSNATLIDEDVVELLKAYPPRRVEVTVYGHTEATYEAVTSVKGSFRNFRRGIDLLMQNGLPVYLKTIVLQTNHHEYEDIKAWAHDLGVPFRDDALVNPRLNGDLAPLAERLDPEEVVRIQGTADEDLNEHHRLRKLAEEYGPDDRLFRCGAGIRTFHVDPQGNLHPCMMWRHNPYPLLEDTPDMSWKEHVLALRDDYRPQNSRCTACPNTLACGNCAATSILETGVPGKHVNYYCEISQAREKLLLKSMSTP